MAVKEINQTHIEKLKQQRRVVGLLHFKFRDDQKFLKWFTLTENLVIRAFSEKSNQTLQLRTIKKTMLTGHDPSYELSRLIDSKEATEKFKDLLTNFISELELDLPNVYKTQSKSKNCYTNKQYSITKSKINLSVEVQNIISNVRKNEPDPEKVTEAESKLKEFEIQMKSDNPMWSKVKDILIWLLNFSRDAFIQVLPILLERYKI